MKSHIRFSLVATVATICVASLAVHAWTSPPNQAGSDRSERIVPALPSQASRPHNIVVRIDAVTLVEQTESTKLLKLDVARYYGKITTDSLNRARKHESSQFSILFPAALDADIRPGDLLNYWLVGYTPMRDGNVADNRGVAPQVTLYGRDSMNTAQIDFRSLPWVSVGPGAQEKRLFKRNVILRLLQLSPPFVEEQWCVREHVGYVLDGEFSIQFHDRTEQLCAGDGIAIEGGAANAHKAIVQKAVLLFLVEPLSDCERNS